MCSLLVLGCLVCLLYLFIQDEARKAAGEAWYKTMISDSDYTEFEIFGKWLGVTQ